MSIGQLADKYHGEMIPLSGTFSYCCASVPLSDEDIKEYLEEPIAALPPSVAARLPKISIILVPYLERSQKNGKVRNVAGERGDQFAVLEKPADGQLSTTTQIRRGEEEVLVFALKDQEIAEYHYRLYHHLATIIGNQANEEEQQAFARLIREELNANVHGEVDEESWRLKQALQRRQTSTRDSKALRLYIRQAFIDTLTLYLHGLCCDIDVETGPRQLPSRYLRARLKSLFALYPPPAGYAVFPEDMKP